VNRWKIPAWLETEIKARDRDCIYCRVAFDRTRGDRRYQATWEHIVNDSRIVTRGNIALCCGSCNASKGNKELVVWLKSDYCRRRGITADSIADVVKMALPSDG
jgi:hypothetical protein